MNKALFLALAALAAGYARCAVSVTASRAYVDRKTSVSSVTDAGEEVGFFIGTNTNAVFAGTGYVYRVAVAVSSATNALRSKTDMNVYADATGEWVASPPAGYEVEISDVSWVDWGDEDYTGYLFTGSVTKDGESFEFYSSMGNSYPTGTDPETVTSDVIYISESETLYVPVSRFKGVSPTGDLLATKGELAAATNGVRSKTDLAVYVPETTPWRCTTVRASGDYSSMTNLSKWTFTCYNADESYYPSLYYDGQEIGDCNSPMPEDEYPTSPSWNMFYDEDLDVTFEREIKGMTVGLIATRGDATNAAIAVADSRISTNNAAFVAAVLAAPLSGADADDLSEIAEYGSYGTVGAALLALIAGLAALKRRMATAETEIDGKADMDDLPYELVTPGEWTYSGLPDGVTVSGMSFDENTYVWTLTLSDGSQIMASGGGDTEREVHFYPESGEIVASRSSPGQLVDRAVNAVSVSSATTLTLPPAVAGRARDLVVRLSVIVTSQTITFAPSAGDTIDFETDGDEFPVPDSDGTWLYSFTETAAGKLAVSLKRVTSVAQGGA